MSETFKQDTRILGAMQRRMVQRNAERQAHRDMAYLHGSEICKADWCPRASWYRITGVEPDSEEKLLSWMTVNVYDEGNDIHERHQSTLWDIGVLEGVFRCLVCEYEWWDTSPETCFACAKAGRPHGRPFLVYLEVPILNDDLLFIGHGDGIIKDDKGRALLEIKSIGEGTLRFEVPVVHEAVKDGRMSLREAWGNIKRPLPSPSIRSWCCTSSSRTRRSRSSRSRSSPS